MHFYSSLFWLIWEQDCLRGYLTLTWSLEAWNILPYKLLSLNMTETQKLFVWLWEICQWIQWMNVMLYELGRIQSPDMILQHLNAVLVNFLDYLRPADSVSSSLRWHLKTSCIFVSQDAQVVPILCSLRMEALKMKIKEPWLAFDWSSDVVDQKISNKTLLTDSWSTG